MGSMASNTQRTILPDFQKFLRERKLAPEKHIPFHAHWVSLFLSFARRRHLSATEYQEATVTDFLEELKSDKKVLDWQHRHAEHALRLYYFHYLNVPAVRIGSGTSQTDIPDILKEMTRMIRLKHYSYSIERTYMQWTERFLAYALASTKKSVADITSEDFKNFISHLALKQRVSSSTQNQAFNAILFLFKNVLGKEANDLSNTIRAKRGPKLPVVLSVDEVKRLFSYMSGTTLLMA
jgi:integrase